MRIWNLTPHAMQYDDGTTKCSFESDGALRLEQIDRAAEPIHGLATVETTYGQVQGLPDGIGPGDVLIVSTLVGDQWKSSRPEGVIVLVPDTGPSCRRDSAGRIVSVTRFIRK